MIGAGAVVTKSVPANAVVVGNPAAIVGYQAERVLTKSGEAVSGRGLGDRPGSRQQLSVKGCELWRLPQFEDMRGSIVPLEFSKQGLPFAPLRAFVVYDVPSREVRGEHAHRTCKQFLIAAQGQLAVVMDDGRNREEVVLDKPTIGLFMPPLDLGHPVQIRTPCNVARCSPRNRTGRKTIFATMMGLSPLSRQQNPARAIRPRAGVWGVFEVRSGELGEGAALAIDFVEARRSDGVVGESVRFYLPALDGLRFIAFLLVLIHHTELPPQGMVWISRTDG